MDLIRYVCTNCGHRFEAPQKEALDCPNCFWSTSVRREDEVKKAAPEPAAGKPSVSPKLSPGIKNRIPVQSVMGALGRTLGIGTVVLLAGFLLMRGIPKLAGFISNQKQKAEIKKQEKIDQALKASVPAVPTGLAALTEDERATLNLKIEIPSNRPPSEEEKRVLENQASLQTGIVERLPSQAWNLENFKQMISEQEKFYKVPLPHSYKSKLEDVFKKNYLPAAQAFEAGNLVQARDLWVGALVFPVYGNNIQKHRGVVLTMLRSFINDTLSKIGAINGTLSEQQTRDREREVNERYMKLLELIHAQSWAEAQDLIGKLKAEIDELEKMATAPRALPPYPPAVQQVDQDIRATLFELANPQPPTLADFDPITTDIRAKQNVIQSFIQSNLDQQLALYNDALNLIQQGQYGEAEKKLSEIRYPLDLLKDAQEKVKVLKKIDKGELDSAPK